MAKLLPWVMMPSDWIVGGGLQKFRWAKGEGPNNVAAFMTFVVILHLADRLTGVARVTYDQFERATSLSRSKVAAGLRVLEQHGVIERAPAARSTYQVSGYNPSQGWAKFPALRLYDESGRIVFFSELHLRKPTELDALKLWLFIAARRDNDANLAKVTYDQIAAGTGILRERIRTAVSMLAANGLVHVDHVPSRFSEYGVANGYRLPQVDPTRHMGSTGRGMTAADVDAMWESA